MGNEKETTTIPSSLPFHMEPTIGTSFPRPPAPPVNMITKQK